MMKIEDKVKALEYIHWVSVLAPSAFWPEEKNFEPKFPNQTPWIFSLLCIFKCISNSWPSFETKKHCSQFSFKYIFKCQYVLIFRWQFNIVTHFSVRTFLRVLNLIFNIEMLPNEGIHLKKQDPIYFYPQIMLCWTKSLFFWKIFLLKNL